MDRIQEGQKRQMPGCYVYIANAVPGELKAQVSRQ